MEGYRFIIENDYLLDGYEEQGNITFKQHLDKKYLHELKHIFKIVLKHKKIKLTGLKKNDIIEHLNNNVELIEGCYTLK